MKKMKNLIASRKFLGVPTCVSYKPEHFIGRFASIRRMCEVLHDVTTKEYHNEKMMKNAGWALKKIWYQSEIFEEVMENFMYLYGEAVKEKCAKELDKQTFFKHKLLRLFPQKLVKLAGLSDKQRKEVVRNTRLPRMDEIDSELLKKSLK